MAGKATGQGMLDEIANLRQRLQEAEDTLRAIGNGEVDAFVVSGPEGEQIFTLKGAEQLYRILVETMHEGAATLNSDGTILYSNNSLASLLEVPLETLMGKALASYVAPSDQQLFAAMLEKCVRECDREEISLITGRGTVVPTLISYCTLNLPGSQLISAVITDITPHKLNEEFKEAERLARSIIDQAGEIIIVCDKKGEIIRASRLAHNLCMDNPLLKPFHDLIELRHPESGEWVSILPAEPGGCLKHVEVECRRDGETMSFILNVSPLEGSREQLLGYIVTLTDITERKKFRTQLLAINEELERRVEQRTRELQETHARYLHAEKLSAIGKLSASIAHEFNNPLQGIMSILQGFRRITMEDEDRAMLETAIAESVRMKNLVRNLQDFNRPSSGKKVLVDLHLSLNSLLLLCKSDFKRKRISLVLRYAEDLPQVLAIPDQIKQVFLNLLTNAADACFQSEGVITITTRREGGWVAVAIEDNGIGINPENLDLILQPFFTTKPEVKGTGLGLSISHGIIRSHRGEIRIESQPGKGSVFTVLLPIDGER